MPKKDDPSTSLEIQPLQSLQKNAKSNTNETNESENDKKEDLPQTHLRLKELLLQTRDTQLSEDGKRIECMGCGKSAKLEK